MKRAQRARLAALARGLQFLASVCVALSAFLLNKQLTFGKECKHSLRSLTRRFGSFLWQDKEKEHKITIGLILEEYFYIQKKGEFSFALFIVL